VSQEWVGHAIERELQVEEAEEAKRREQAIASISSRVGWMSGGVFSLLSVIRLESLEGMDTDSVRIPRSPT
jgi:hypothetical protein